MQLITENNKKQAQRKAELREIPIKEIIYHSKFTVTLNDKKISENFYYLDKREEKNCYRYFLILLLSVKEKDCVVIEVDEKVTKITSTHKLTKRYQIHLEEPMEYYWDSNIVGIEFLNEESDAYSKVAVENNGVFQTFGCSNCSVLTSRVEKIKNYEFPCCSPKCLKELKEDNTVEEMFNTSLKIGDKKIPACSNSGYTLLDCPICKKSKKWVEYITWDLVNKSTRCYQNNNLQNIQKAIYTTYCCKKRHFWDIHNLKKWTETLPLNLILIEEMKLLKEKTVNFFKNLKDNLSLGVEYLKPINYKFRIKFKRWFFDG